jgi:hypothetical protein
MKILTSVSLIAIALLGSTPAMAQPGPNGWNRPGQGQPGQWNRDEFWRGAPDNVSDRIGFLQRRIDKGVSNGSLSPREARAARNELHGISRDTRRRGGRLSPQDRDNIQARLDQLSQRLHWRGDGRADGYGGQPGGYPGPQSGGYNNGGYSNAQPGQYDDRQFATTYDASRDYRDGPNYSERKLSAQDQVYRGSDGRYYCKRNDGTTGLIVGAVGGGLLGNVIDGGHNRVAGTLIGGALGALAGKAIEQSNDVRCK